MPPSDAAAAELTQGVIIEQRFQAKVQRLESVSVQWGIYYRPNSGTVRMELLRVSVGNVLLNGTFDAASITEGQTLSIQAAEPVETAYNTPLLLRLSSDALPGKRCYASGQHARGRGKFCAHGQRGIHARNTLLFRCRNRLHLDRTALLGICRCLWSAAGRMPSDRGNTLPVWETELPRQRADCGEQIPFPYPPACLAGFQDQV